MRIRWRGLELPNQVVRDEETSTDCFGRFTIEPFERGFGTTIGNSLRRILLSSLEGAAVTRVKIQGAPHEFTSLTGVLEDVTDIVLNIKGLAIRMEGEDPCIITVSRNSKGEVKAGDIETDANIEIINAEHHLVTLTEKVEFSAEMTVEKGRGWRASEDNLGVEADVEVFPIDSSFSPVTRVRYKAEDTRVGQRTNFDRLVMEVWTNGTIDPEDALVEAARILRKHLNPFVLYDETGADQVIEPMREAVSAETKIDSDLQAKLDLSITELELSVRANNCLESARIMTVGELARCTESELLRVRSFGKTSLREVRRKLAELGLSLGSDFSGGDPAALPDVLASVPPQPEAGLTHEDILPPAPETSLPGHGLPAASNPVPDVNPFRVGP